MARHRKGIPIDGVLLLDKPSDMTSNAIMQRVKRLFNAQKAGHTGSLDPLATGLLPVCFGQATKFSQFLLDADKCYHVVAKLGVTTTTGDSEGEVAREVSVQIEEPQLRQAMQQFLGEIHQVPSMYSALKHQGKPLYAYARQGIEIDRPARPVSIYKLELESKVDSVFSFVVHCSKGTYVRTLVEDIGKVLECGAHVTGLRRLQVGPYKEEQMVSYDRLQDLYEAEQFKEINAYLLPVQTSVQQWPTLPVSETEAFYLLQGQAISVASELVAEFVQLVCGSRFLGMGEIQRGGKVFPKRLIATSRNGLCL